MKPASNSLRRSRPLLGTFVEIAVTGAARGPMDAAIDAAFDTVAEIHWLMSFHESTSDVARLNRLASTQAVTVHPWTFRVLETALDLARRSMGAFDIAIAPALQDLSLLPRDGQESRTSAAVSRAGPAIELLAGNRVRFHDPRVMIDLGGIAKGFAVDCAVAALLARGIAQGVVNAGGDLAAFGADAAHVRIRDPRDPRRVLCEVELRDAALASSGTSIDPVHGSIAKASAVIDPRTGLPVSAISGASVRAPFCVIADALTKVVMIAGEAAMPLLLQECASAMIVADGGDVRATADWQATVRRAA